MKLCKRCNTKQPLTEFHADNGAPDKKMYHCKTCGREIGRNYRLRHREELRARDRERKKRPEIKAKVKASLLKSHRLHPERRRARKAVYRAIKRGNMKRGNCWCGKPGQAHHDDYSQKYAVTWLCKEHHIQHHFPDSVSNVTKVVDEVTVPA